VLAASAAGAQTPPQAIPARTTWEPFPAAPPLVHASHVPSPVDSPPDQPAIGTRVVVFQKPAGDDRPVTRPAPAKARTPARLTAMQDEEPEKPKEKGKATDPEKPAEKELQIPKPNQSAPVDPKPIDIQLLDDARLDAELIRAYDAQQTEAYKRSTEEMPKKPKPLTREQLPPSEKVRELLARGLPPSAPRSVMGTAPSPLYLEPSYVVHRRLMFEEKNSERYGWNLGILQPAVSAAYFYKDLLIYPMKLASNLGERYDASAGKAMPGSPVPYLFYPPELTFGGVVLGSTAILGTVFLLP